MACLRKRQKCTIPGCNKLGYWCKKSQGRGAGNWYYRKTCELHRIDGTPVKQKGKAYYQERGWKYKGIVLDREAYLEKFNKQNGCCAICGIHQSEYSRALDADHNHSTKQVRSLLCTNCNRLVDEYERDKSKYKAIIDYIKYWDSQIM